MNHDLKRCFYSLKDEAESYTQPYIARWWERRPDPLLSHNFVNLTSESRLIEETLQEATTPMWAREGAPPPPYRL